MKKRGILLFIFMLSLSSIASGNALSLDRAIEILKSNNLEVKIAKLDQKMARKDVDIANGNNFGKIDFQENFANSDDAGNVFGFKLTSREANFGDFGADEFMNTTQEKNQDGTDNPNYVPGGDYQTPPNGLNYPDNHNFFQSKIRYQIPLFAGFKISSYVNIMKAMNRMKTLKKSKVLKEKIYQLRKSYYDMALIKSSQRHLNNILNNIHKLENTTQNMIEVGYAKKVDLLEVKAKKGNIQRLLIDMRLNQKLLYHYISFLLNKKVTNIVFPGEDVPMPKISSKTIIETNLDIKMAQTGLKIRKNMLTVGQASMYPMVGASLEYQTSDNDFADSIADAATDGSYTVGARMNWNLYNGGIDSANIQKAKIEYLKTRVQVQLARKGIGLKIAKIKTEIKSKTEKIVFLEKELALANEIYTNYEGRYKEKLASMNDVIIKESEQIEKILKLQKVKNERNERIFALEKLANGEQ